MGQVSDMIVGNAARHSKKIPLSKYLNELRRVISQYRKLPCESIQLKRYGVTPEEQRVELQG